MTNIKDRLKWVLDFFVRNRQSGTTTLLVKIAKENDVWVLVPTEKDGKQFGEKAVTFAQLEAGKKDSLAPKPILVDNYTMLQLNEQSYNHISKLDEHLKRRNDFLVDMAAVIAKYNKECKAAGEQNPLGPDFQVRARVSGGPGEFSRWE